MKKLLFLLILILWVTTACNSDIEDIKYTETPLLETETPTLEPTATRTPADTAAPPPTITPTATISPIRLDAKVIYFSFTVGEIRVIDLQSRTDTAIYAEGENIFSSPQFLSDGERFVFLSDQDNTHGIWNLYIGNINGSEPIRITNHSHPEYYLTVSPDRSMAVFVRELWNGEKPSHDLFLFDLDSGKISRLTFDGLRKSSLTWSHDGTKIAYTKAESMSFGDLVIISSDGSEEYVLVKDIILDDNWISWSGDDTKIVAPAKRKEGVLELLVTDIETNTHSFVTELGWKCFYPDWSAKRDVIVFKCNDNFIRNIFLLDMNNQVISQLTEYPEPEQPYVRGLIARWSPDGGYLFMVSQENLRTHTADLHLIDENGSFHQLTQGQMVGIFDAWMPSP